jgi:hypothetical protein
MLRNTVILTLLISTLVATFDKSFIVLNFFANQKYIAQNLCENRNKPKLNCCGKCQLRKKMNQEEKNSQLPERKAMNEILFCSELITYKFSAEAIPDNKFPRLDPIIISYSYSDIFHPPQSTSI